MGIPKSEKKKTTDPDFIAFAKKMLVEEGWSINILGAYTVGDVYALRRFARKNKEFGAIHEAYKEKMVRGYYSFYD